MAVSKKYRLVNSDGFTEFSSKASAVVAGDATGNPYIIVSPAGKVVHEADPTGVGTAIVAELVANWEADSDADDLLGEGDDQGSLEDLLGDEKPAETKKAAPKAKKAKEPVAKKALSKGTLTWEDFDADPEDAEGKSFPSDRKEGGSFKAHSVTTTESSRWYVLKDDKGIQHAKRAKVGWVKPETVAPEQPKGKTKAEKVAAKADAEAREAEDALL